MLGVRAVGSAAAEPLQSDAAEHPLSSRRRKSMAEVRNVICVVIDGLQPAFLGAYGNTWIATPDLDRLAAESFVCDTALDRHARFGADLSRLLAGPAGDLARR